MRTNDSFPYKVVNNRLVGLPKEIRPRSKRFLRTKCPINWWNELSTYQHQGGALADLEPLVCYFYELGQENALGPVEKLEQNESVNEDRKALKYLVESYGKADVLKYINHLNEMRTTTTSREQFAAQVSDDLDMFMYDEANDNGNEHLDAWFFNDFSGKPETDDPINKYINSRIPGQWEIVQLAGNGTNVGMGIFYEPNYDVYLSLESYDEEEKYITHYDVYLSEDCPWI